MQPRQRHCGRCGPKATAHSMIQSMASEPNSKQMTCHEDRGPLRRALPPGCEACRHDVPQARIERERSVCEATAKPRLVVRQVLSRVVMLVGIGVVIGAATSLWALQFMEALLFSLKPRDSTTFVGAVVVLVVVGALAGWLPAWRALPAPQAA